MGSYARRRWDHEENERIMRWLEEEQKKRELEVAMARVPWRMLETEIKKLSQEVEKKRQVEEAKHRLKRLEMEARAKLQSLKEMCELREKKMEKQIKILRNVDSAVTSAISVIPKCGSNILVSVGSLYGKFTGKLAVYGEMQAQILYEISQKKCILELTKALKLKNKK